MTRIRVMTVAIAVLGVIAIGTAFAQGPRGGGPGPGRGFGPGGGQGAGLVLRGLDLTDAQQDQVRAIRERYGEQMREATERLATGRRAQREAIEAVPADENQIVATTHELAQAQIDVAILQSRVNIGIWAVLTPEQQAQVTARRAERGERAGERRGRLEERRQQRGQPARAL